MTSHTLEERVSALEADAYRHQRADGKLHGDVAHISDGLDTVSGDLRSLAHEVRTEVLPRLDRIVARLVGLEDGQMALTARVDGLTERVDGLTERVDGLTERVDGLTEQVGTLTARVGRVERGVDALLAHFGVTVPDEQPPA